MPDPIRDLRPLLNPGHSGLEIAEQAKEALREVLGEEAVADGRLQPHEVGLGYFDQKTLEIIGVRDGSPITAEQGQLLLAQGIAQTPTGEQPKLSLPVLLESAKQFADRGRELADSDAPGALCALVTATRLYRLIEQDTSTDSKSVREIRGNLETMILTLVERELANAQQAHSSDSLGRFSGPMARAALMANEDLPNVVRNIRAQGWSDDVAVRFASGRGEYSAYAIASSLTSLIENGKVFESFGMSPPQILELANRHGPGNGALRARLNYVTSVARQLQAMEVTDPGELRAVLEALEATNPAETEDPSGPNRLEGMYFRAVLAGMMSGMRLDDTLDWHPRAALMFRLREAGLTDPAEIKTYLAGLPQAAKDGNLLKHLLEAGLDSSQAAAMAREVVTAVGLTQIGDNITALTTELIEKGVKDPAQMGSILRTIRQAAPPPDSALAGISGLFGGGHFAINPGVDFVRAILAGGATPGQALAAMPRFVGKAHPRSHVEVSVIRSLAEKRVDWKEALQLVERARQFGDVNNPPGYYALPIMVDLLNKQGIDSPDERQKIVDFVLQFGGGAASDLAQVMVDVDFNVKHANYDDFSGHLAERFNQLIEEHGVPEQQGMDIFMSRWLSPTGSPNEEVSERMRRAFSSLTTLINDVHDRDGQYTNSDRLRTSFAAALDPEASYTLMAYGGDQLYTSSFNALQDSFERKVDRDQLGVWLRTTDPENHLTGRLMGTWTRFGKQEWLAAGHELFWPILLKETDASNATTSTAARLAPVLKELFGQVSPEQRAELETRLLSTLGEGQPVLSEAGKAGHTADAVHEHLGFEPALSSARNVEREAAAAYLLRTVRDAHEDLLSPAGFERADALPAVPTGEPLIEEWLKDGAITAEMVFYEDEAWRDESIRVFRSNGFKPDREYISEHGLEATGTIALYRMQSGVRQRILFSIGPKSEEEKAFHPQVDIGVHRGHSYHFSDTFSGAGADSDDIMLLFGGSCGSFRAMTAPGFIGLYGQHLLLADANTGEGAINNAILFKLLNGIAKGETDWRRMGLGQYTGERGLRLPDDPGLLAGNYLHRYAEATGQELNTGPSMGLLAGNLPRFMPATMGAEEAEERD